MFGVPSSETLLMLYVRSRDLRIVQTQAVVVISDVVSNVAATLELGNARELPTIDELATKLAFEVHLPRSTEYAALKMCFRFPG